MASAQETRMLQFAKFYGKDMIAALNGSPIYFAVMLVQASNESGYGTSYSAVHRNNFFGIMQGKKKKVFASPQDCFSYYINLLSNSPRYLAKGVSSSTSPYEQIRRIADAGYYDANNDDTLPASQKYPNKKWTAAQSADHYYSVNKKLIDSMLLAIPIGTVNNNTLASASKTLTTLNV